MYTEKEIKDFVCKECTLFIPYTIPIVKCDIIPKPLNCCVYIYAKDKEGCKVYDSN